MTAYGATLDEWKTWAETLGLLGDLLPVVSNPTATLSPHSSIREVGKTPSTYNAEGNVSGFPRWTDNVAAPGDIAAWAAQPDYGICVNTRGVHAFDVDLDDAETAGKVWAILQPYGAMTRVRANSPRFLVVFRPETPFKARKPIVFGRAGKVEFYGIGKQFVACGTHPSGARYQYTATGTTPPVLTVAEVEALWSAIEALAPAEVRQPVDESASTEDLIAAIEAGDSLHEALRGLAWRGWTVQRLTELMNRSGARASDPKRWSDRLADIPRYVESTITKRAEEAGRVFGEPVALPPGATAPGEPAPYKPEDRRAAQLEEARRIGEGEDEPDLLPTIMTLEDMIRDLVYVGSTGVVVHLPTRRVRRGERARDEFKASKDFWIDGNGNRKEAECYPLWIESAGRKSVDLITWSPGDGVICDAPEREEGGSRAVNLWGGWNAPDVPDDWQERLGAWNEHLAYLIPIESERREFEQWCAHIAQKPGELPHRFYLKRLSLI